MTEGAGTHRRAEKSAIKGEVEGKMFSIPGIPAQLLVGNIPRSHPLSVPQFPHCSNVCACMLIKQE